MQYGTNGQLQTLAMPIEKRIGKEALLKAKTVLADTEYVQRNWNNFARSYVGYGRWIDLQIAGEPTNHQNDYCRFERRATLA
jgi:hypothetical protein